MAENNKDHLADALSAMSAGEHDESDEPSLVDVPITPAPSSRQSAPKPTAGLRPAVPAFPPAMRSATPVAKPTGKVRPTVPAAAPVPQGRPIAPIHPALPAMSAPPISRRSTSPTAASAHTPNPRPPETVIAPSFVTPDAPTQAFGESTPGQDWMGTAPQDDDTMMAPAPDASAFTGHSTSYKSTTPRKPRVSEWKPTVIPILLTTGVLFLAFSSLKVLLGADSPFTALPVWVVGMVAGMGVLLLGLAMFTMMQVKAELESLKTK